MFLQLRNARNSIQSATSPNLHQSCENTWAIFLPLSAPQLKVINVIISSSKISGTDAACFHHPVCIPVYVMCKKTNTSLETVLTAYEMLLSFLAKLVILYFLIMAASKFFGIKNYFRKAWRRRTAHLKCHYFLVLQCYFSVQLIILLGK